jgi:hypothetical protein
MAGNLRNEVAIPLDVRCACSKPKRIPVSLDAEFWAVMLLMLSNINMNPDQKVFVVYCRHCSTQGYVRVGDLSLDNGAGLRHMLGADYEHALDVVGDSG